MRKLLLIVAVAATALLLDSGMASARGCRGGRGGRHGGGCGSSCYSGGCSMGGYYGGCSTCGIGGGYYGGGCATCGGGYAYGAGSVGVYAAGYCAQCAAVGVPQQAAVPTQGATLIVELPADATLTIDDAPTTSTSATRTFVTPDLKPGKVFHYTLKATVKRDGEDVVVSRKVEVESGKISRISLPLPTTTVAAE